MLELFCKLVTETLCVLNCIAKNKISASESLDPDADLFRVTS